MSWMQDIRDGNLIRGSLFGCMFGHEWIVQQHFFRAADDDRVEVVIAWKQCHMCGKSKLIHILV